VNSHLSYRYHPTADIPDPVDFDKSRDDFHIQTRDPHKAALFEFVHPPVVIAAFPFREQYQIVI
jgi:hypothetical protein